MPDLILNQDLKANNVFEFNIEFDKVYNLVSAILEQLNHTSLFDPTKKSIHLSELSLPMFVQIPNWNGDIAWISAASKESFEFFDLCFRELQIENKTRKIAHLDFPLMMYSGFFVARSYVTSTYYHEDYTKECGNNAFTMMTPVQIDETAEFGHLLYKNVFQKESKYRYKKGNAIIFGSDFIHSTEPFESKQKYIFLCFTYGTTDLTKWDNIKETVTEQGVSYRNPNGIINVTNAKFKKYF